MSNFYCDKCGTALIDSPHGYITECEHYPITPPKGEKMPQTREYWEKRADMDQELILKQRDEIGELKQRINKLQQERASILKQMWDLT